MTSENLLIRAVTVADRDALAGLFRAFAGDPQTARFFHPHPLTAEQAALLCRRQGKDRYFLAWLDGIPAGYALLRGWDEGFAIPSFGACVHPALQGKGIGKALLRHAIAESRAAGAARLRLTVYRANARARRLYEGFGFRFAEKDEGSLVGFLELPPPAERG